MIKVPASDFKKIFEVIRRELPAAYTSLDDFDAKEEYLTKIYHRDEKTAEVEYHSDLGGWVEFEGVSPRFYVGEDKFYAGMEILPPIVPYRNHRKIFIDGFSFRQIGHGNDVIEILWIVAHIALSLFWFRKFGVDFRSVIFLKGKTNMFKTTVVSLLANSQKTAENQTFAFRQLKPTLRNSSQKCATILSCSTTSQIRLVRTILRTGVHKN